MVLHVIKPIVAAPFLSNPLILTKMFSFVSICAMTGRHHGSRGVFERGSSYERGQTPKPRPAAGSVFMNAAKPFFRAFLKHTCSRFLQYLF